MTLTASEITISNLALGLIGEYQISASQPNTKQYELCERFYDDALREAIVEHNWNECKKRSILIEYSVPPTFGYLYKFALPTDCLKVVRIGDGQNDWDMWEVEGSYILTNYAQSPLAYTVGEDYIRGQYITYSNVTYSVDTSFTAADWTTDSAAYLTSQTYDYSILYIEYLFENTDTTMWSPKFKDVVAQKLAMKLCVPITNNPKSKSDLLNEFEGITIRKARSVDAQQGRIRPIYKSQWWNSRNSS